MPSSSALNAASTPRDVGSLAPALLWLVDDVRACVWAGCCVGCDVVLCPACFVEVARVVVVRWRVVVALAFSVCAKDRDDDARTNTMMKGNLFSIDNLLKGSDE